MPMIASCDERVEYLLRSVSTSYYPAPAHLSIQKKRVDILEMRL